MSWDVLAPALRDVVSKEYALARLQAPSSNNRRRQPRRLADLKQSALAELAGWFANRHAQPLFVVDARMTVVLINDAGHRALQQLTGIELSGQRLVIHSHKHRAQINRVLNEETDAASFTLRRAGSIAQARVVSAPLPGAGKLLLVSVSCAGDCELDCEFVQTKLGLTRAEAEIAVALFEGLSLLRIAKARKTSINTVKTQVRFIFQKCRAHTRVALVRRLNEVIGASA